MKTYVAVPLVVALLGGMMLAGGCVAKKDYDDLRAMNQRANDELKGALEALQALRVENKRLVDEIQARQAALTAANEKNALLERALAELQDKFDKLLAGGTRVETAPTALPDDLNAELKDLADKNGWEFDEKRGVVRISSDLTFEKGSDVVLPNAKSALEKFAKVMQGPTASKFYIYVAGHTDNIPIKSTETKRRHPNNWYLSVHRAVSVEEVLTGANMAPNRIGAMGYGEYYPIVPNAAGNKGNATNRRVELWIVPAEKFLVLPMGESKATKAAPAAPAKPAEEDVK